MGLLQEIIEGARGSTVTTTELLRSVRVLAVRGQAHDLGDWVKRELAGYPKDVPLPSYRGPFGAQVLGLFTGPMNSQPTVPIATFGFPEAFDSLFQIEFRASISELEGMLDADFENKVGFPWPADAVAWANKLMDENKVGHLAFHGLHSAHRPVSKNMLLGTINAVRDRILDLALELEQVSPDLDYVASGGGAIQSEKMSAVYQTVVMGGQVFVGENTTQQQLNAQVLPGDVASLDRFLQGLGITAEGDRRELIEAAEAALAEGPQTVEKSGRLSAAIKKIGGAVGKAAPGVVTDVLKAAVTAWLTTT